jgi:hypothetical protein
MSDSLYTDESESFQPDAVKATSGSSNSPLSRLKETISKKVQRNMILLEVPDRDDVYLRISPNITQQQMKSWRRNAGEDSKKGLDPTKFAAYVIGHTTIGIEMGGEEIFDEDGNALNFASKDILESTDTTRPVPDAVLAFFNLDPHVEAAALAILEASGYGETVETVDPTKQS